MAEHDSKKNEIRRMRTLLQKMAEMAEHAEQTGSFESATHNYVRRYNAIVEHLEDNDVVPEDLFPKLEEETDFGQMGAEAKLLADYLDDILEESPKASNRNETKPDLGLMVALAPFLESRELSKIVSQHFTGPGGAGANEGGESAQGPDLKTIASLAPHVDRMTLAEMVRACLAREPLRDPHLLLSLAPHMDRHEFSRLLREYLPNWFGGQAPAPPEENVSATGANGENWLEAHNRPAQANPTPSPAPQPPAAPEPSAAPPPPAPPER